MTPPLDIDGNVLAVGDDVEVAAIDHRNATDLTISVALNKYKIGTRHIIDELMGELDRFSGFVVSLNDEMLMVSTLLRLIPRDQKSHAPRIEFVGVKQGERV